MAFFPVAARFHPVLGQAPENRACNVDLPWACLQWIAILQAETLAGNFRETADFSLWEVLLCKPQGRQRWPSGAVLVQTVVLLHHRLQQ